MLGLPVCSQIFNSDDSKMWINFIKYFSFLLKCYCLNNGKIKGVVYIQLSNLHAYMLPLYAPLF